MKDDSLGTNCDEYVPETCSNSEFGCCDDDLTYKTSDDDLCCHVSNFGCCSDNSTPKTSKNDTCCQIT